MYVCMYVCMYVWGVPMYVCMYACMRTSFVRMKGEFPAYNWLCVLIKSYVFAIHMNVWGLLLYVWMGSSLHAIDYVRLLRAMSLRYTSASLYYIPICILLLRAMRWPYKRIAVLHTNMYTLIKSYVFALTSAFTRTHAQRWLKTACI